MLTTAQLKAAHDALHRLIAHGEVGETNYTDEDAREAYEKVSAEVRKRDRRSAVANALGQRPPRTRH